MLPTKQQALSGRSSSLQGKSVQLAAARGASRARQNHTSRAIAEPPARSSPAPPAMSNGSSAAHTSEDIVKKLKYNFGKQTDYSKKDAYHGTAWSVRERLVDAFDKTHEYWK